MGVSLGLIAVRYGCELRGDPDKVVDRVATLSRADDRCVTFLANSAYRGQLAGTRAAAVILAPAEAGDCPVDALVTREPYVVYARVAAELHPAPEPRPGVHTTAVVAPGVVIPASCEIGPGVVLGRDVVLGERVVVGPRTVLGERVVVGADTRFMPGVTVYADVRIGARCVLHTGVVLGSDGFGFAREREGSYVKVPQLGSVEVGDDVEIGPTPRSTGGPLTTPSSVGV